MPDETAGEMTDNGALNEIVVQLLAIIAFLIGAYDEIDGDSTFSTVTDSAFKERDADPLSRRVSVSNNGPDTAQVLEGGVIVMLVPPGESRELPSAGQGEILIRAATGENASVALATYKDTV